MRLLLLLPVLTLGCDGEPTTVVPTDVTPTPTEDVTPDPGDLDCSAYDYRGATYDCETGVDFCDNTAENLTARLACCECDPALCLAPTDCPPPDPGEPTPVTPPPPPPTPPGQTSCMSCHNGALDGEQLYSGPGISNPHYFGSAAYISCVGCHGGNPDGQTRQEAHVAPPPTMTNDQQLINDQVAYFNYLTRTGLDKYPDWTQDGNTVTGIDWLNFMNPGDTRVTSQGRGCGSCHSDHAGWVEKYPINTEVGFYSATNFTSGVSNALGYTQYGDTAGDYAFRAVYDPDFDAIGGYDDGRVPQLIEYPEYGVYAPATPQAGQFYQNTGLLAANLNTDLHDGNFAGFDVNRIIDGSNMEHLVEQVIALTCGDCHLGSQGANNRYADFRSSGCTACHMEYSPDGKSRSTDPNVPKFEPADPDAIAAPERAHIDSHQIRNVAKFLPGGGFIRGISDRACAGCHQGSNRTVLQYWGIRMDQNKDVVLGFQYPANPQTFVTTEFDTRLYDPAVNNNTWNGRDFEQHLLEEDYDGDTLDDTPPDIHYERGMGCIDCHGEFDMHGGATDSPVTMGIKSHQSQAMGITCESCHGTIDDYPTTVSCTDYDGYTTECPTDRFGNPIRNVRKVTQNGHDYFQLRSRVTGDILWVPLTKDTVDGVSGKQHPVTGQLLYSPNASYAMGRIGAGVDADGVGPQQTNPQFSPVGFTHDGMLDCNACHASWTNSCIGCHLKLFYNADPANFFFSNTTGERTVMNFDALFTYQSPVLRYLTVGTQGKITQGAPGMKMFFQYTDIQNNTSDVFAFTDRSGFGNVPDLNGRNAFPALAHNKIAPHSTRGRVTGQNEGVASCNTCHLNEDMLADDFNNDGVTNLEDYEQFIDLYLNNNDFDTMNNDGVFDLLQVVIGQNFGNQLNHPIYVAMNAGLGSGLFLFDANGCPVNPLDANANRFFCEGNAPADNFDANNVVYDLDRTVEFTGVENISMSQPIQTGLSPYRQGSLDSSKSGPIGASIIERLTDPNLGIILDSWIDPNGNAQGDAANYIF